jgi:hypothetical protein
MARSGRLRKETEWRERLARFARAGTSVVRFCADEGVSTPVFYAWRRRLCCKADRTIGAEDAGDARAQRHGLFAPVRVLGAANGGDQVTVWLRGGTRLEIPLSDPNAAGTVLGAILQADAKQAGDRPC